MQYNKTYHMLLDSTYSSFVNSPEVKELAGDTCFFTIGDLISVLLANAHLPVRFIGTNCTVGELISWRGSYNLPAIYPDNFEGNDRPAGAIAQEIIAALKEEHTGYKGGEYYYNQNDEFYVASYGSSAEYKVFDSFVNDGELVLVTRIDPYC